MNAMTWYDHETESLWSQPWGRAIRGPLKGVELFLLPFQLTTWEQWKQAHPDTLVMINDLDRVGGNRVGFSYRFVIGIVVADQSKAYYFLDAMNAGVINDSLGDIPVLVWASDNIYQTFVRAVDGQELTFQQDGLFLLDVETGSTWDAERGIAVAGPLKGKALQAVPSLTAYDWAWRDFYPDTSFYEPAK